MKGEIARGGFGVVYTAEDKAAGSRYAVKRMIAADKEQIASVRKEIKSLRRVSEGCPHMVKLFGAAHNVTKQGMQECVGIVPALSLLQMNRISSAT